MRLEASSRSPRRSATSSGAAGRARASEGDPYGLQFQALVQAPSHAERLDVLKGILSSERKRLAARATLQSMFKKDE